LLVTAWAVCEQLLHAKWQAAGGQRKGTAQGATVALAQHGHLDDSLRAQLDTVRTGRNDWAHELTFPSYDLAWAAADAAGALLSEYYGLPLKLHPLTTISL
jgi:hypothetical protein